MSSMEPPGGRLPIGESPRWIMVHAFVGLGASFAIIFLHALPEGTHPTLRWMQALIPVIVLASLGRLYAHRRSSMSDVETGYLRTAIVLLTIAGIPGTLPLTLVVGPLFFIWTIVEKRKRKTR